MAGRGNISVNQAPQYGDKSALESAAKATTTTQMTGNPTPARGAGRPQVNGPQAQPQQAPPQLPSVPAEHSSMMQEFAQAYRTKAFWDNVLKNYPSEWARLYAADANESYNKLASALRTSTPFFEP